MQSDYEFPGRVSQDDLDRVARIDARIKMSCAKKSPIRSSATWTSSCVDTAIAKLDHQKRTITDNDIARLVAECRQEQNLST